MNPYQRAKQMMYKAEQMYQIKREIISLSEEEFLIIEKKSEQAEVLSEITMAETDKIINEMNDSGRPLFSNETARKTELTKRLAKNKKYGDTYLKYANLLKQQHDIELTQQRKDAEFKLLDAQLRINLGVLQTEARYEKLTINLKTPIVKEKK